MKKKEEQIIHSYKGFDKNLKCRDFQYEIGKEYEHNGEIKVCNSGFHACENPLDIFSYYNPCNSRFAEVEQSGTLEKHELDSKVCSSKIKIGLEINLKSIIEGGLKFIFNKVDWKKENKTTGYQAGSQATGDHAGSQATGGHAGSQATGDHAGSQATGGHAGSQATGDQAGSQATGDHAGSQATGDRAGSQATGYHAGSQATGDHAGSQATGDHAMSSINGYQSKTSITNTDEIISKNAVAIGIGIDNKAKAPLNCWIVLAEHEKDKENNYFIKHIQSIKVDGKKIKADTWYKLENKKFVIVK